MTDKFKKFLEEHDCLEPYTNNIKDLNNCSYFDKFKWSIPQKDMNIGVN